jgi:hypothetical protein
VVAKFRSQVAVACGKSGSDKAAAAGCSEFGA